MAWSFLRRRTAALAALLAAALQSAGALHTRGCQNGAARPCAAEGDELMRRARASKRVAILLRGESFRTPRDEHHFKPDEIQQQHGIGYRYNCGKDSYSAQASLAHQTMQVVSEWQEKGFEVDLFGSTFHCVNGERYTDDLQKLYNGSFKEIRVLGESERKSSTQLTLIRDVIELTYGHMKRTGSVYRHVYILRWDHPYSCEFFRIDDAHDDNVADSGILTGEGSTDNVLLVPAKHMPCFNDYLQNSSLQILPEEGSGFSPTACCEGKCGGGTCFDCVARYMQVYFGVVLPRKLSKFHSCPWWKPPVRKPLPNWLPDSDLDPICDQMNWRHGGNPSAAT